MGFIVFRVDSSNIIGTGHVYRCLNLASFLKKKNEILFVCRNLKGNIIKEIKNKGFKVLINKKTYFNQYFIDENEDAEFIIKNVKKKIDLIISDHYSLNLFWRKKIKKISNKIFVIDDRNIRKKYCDIYLNHNTFSKPNSRKNIRTKNVIELNGIKYLLTGHNLNFKNNIKKNSKKIFIFFGSVDKNNFTQKIINLITNDNFDKYKFFILIGINNKKKYILKKNCLNIKIIKKKIKDFKRFYSKIDNVISGVNTTMYEQLKCGFKPFVVPQNKLQLKIGKDLSKRKYVNLINIKKYNLKNKIENNINFFSNPKSKISYTLRQNSVFNIAKVINNII